MLKAAEREKQRKLALFVNTANRAGMTQMSWRQLAMDFGYPSAIAARKAYTHARAHACSKIDWRLDGFSHAQSN